MWLVFWHGLISVTCFWSLLIVRVLTLHRLGIKSLTLSTKSGRKNLLASIAFFGTIFIWSVFFVINAITPIDFVLFVQFWNIELILWLTIVGIILGTGFQIEMWVAILTMGRSYRIGVDDKSPGNLITNGIYKYSRNPIYLGMDGLVISVFMVQPNLFCLLFAIFAVTLFHVQVLREEKNLTKFYGDKYIEYCKNTKRYFLFF
jgi:protein-S-isoprenylcysteine O-methyltransferase Ste14